MKTFFTADTHFDHASLIQHGARPPFTCVEEWNTVMLDAINHDVGRQDRLFILGDFAWKRPGYWRTQIRCRNVVLIQGNHDQVGKCRNVFGGNFYTTRMVKGLGIPVFLSHYPHCVWPQSHHGSLHLYGHCHYQREAYLDHIWPDRRSMDVSPDTAFAETGLYGVFLAEQVCARLAARTGHDHVQFYNDFQAQRKGK